MVPHFHKGKALTELSQIKKSIGEVQRNQAKLMKKMSKVENEFNNYFFDMDKCHYSVGATYNGA